MRLWAIATVTVAPVNAHSMVRDLSVTLVLNELNVLTGLGMTGIPVTNVNNVREITFILAAAVC